MMTTPESPIPPTSTGIPKIMTPRSMIQALELWHEVSPVRVLGAFQIWMVVAALQETRRPDQPITIADLHQAVPHLATNSIRRHVMNLCSHRSSDAGTGLTASLLTREISPYLDARENALALGPDGLELLSRIMYT